MKRNLAIILCVLVGLWALALGSTAVQLAIRGFPAIGLFVLVAAGLSGLFAVRLFLMVAGRC